MKIPIPVMVCKDADADAIAGEVTNSFYHILVALAHHHFTCQNQDNQDERIFRILLFMESRDFWRC